MKAAVSGSEVDDEFDGFPTLKHVRPSSLHEFVGRIDLAAVEVKRNILPRGP